VNANPPPSSIRHFKSATVVGFNDRPHLHGGDIAVSHVRARGRRRVWRPPAPRGRHPLVGAERMRLREEEEFARAFGGSRPICRRASSSFCEHAKRGASQRKFVTGPRQPSRTPNADPLCFLCCLLFKKSWFPFVSPAKRFASQRKFVTGPGNRPERPTRIPFASFAAFCSKNLCSLLLNSPFYPYVKT
jgi:hypothetical protein